ncbi:hypothetical protein [Alicyclobacillus ferrooxydans]|uniref:Uncharacterized protein n=1 Tax=Alicyclobacillus ferrooxydans TaxID=471514 RepID=A0A0P9GN05_9BACL|nr:hypothetical protein [Alicyclobacillus ferrooxydans]KPV41804.1 hypothetical protein AN477_20450 [Alicyclobacillus ferrooxydans]
MDLYHTWFYQSVLNTSWFVKTIVVVTVTLNITSPIILWFIFRGRTVFGKGGIVSDMFTGMGALYQRSRGKSPQKNRGRSSAKTGSKRG